MNHINAKIKIVFFIIIITAAILPRLLFVLHENYYSSRTLWPDETMYYQIAKNLIHHHAFSLSVNPPYNPTGYRGPMYPFFLFCIFTLLFTKNPIVIYIVQTLLLIPLLFLLHALYRCIIPHPRYYSSYVLLILCFLYPALIIYPFRIIPDFCFMFLIVLSCYMQLKAFANGKIAWYFMSGFLIGITTLCKPASILFPFSMLFLIIWKLKKRCIAYVLIYFIGTLVVLLPWMVRNKMVLNTYMPVLQGGKNLYASTMNRISEIPLKLNHKVELYGRDFLTQEANGMTEAEADREFLKRGFSLIAKHPFVYLKFSFIKGFIFWKNPIGYHIVRNKSKIVSLFFLISYLCFLVLSFMGLGLLCRLQKPEACLPALVVIYFTVFHSLTHSLPRYHLVCLPFLFLGCVAFFNFFSLGE